MTKGAQFAALPLRAIGDGRLSALDIRVLACIAYHDRMSIARGKGQGAWASNEKLAERVGCHYTNLSTAVTRLGKFGYLTRDAHPLNKRLRVYRVLYDGPPDSLSDDKTSDDANTSRDGDVMSRDGHGVGADTVAGAPDCQGPPPIVCDETNEVNSIVCPSSKISQQSQSQDHVEYISLSDERYSAEAEKDIQHKLRDELCPPRSAVDVVAWKPEEAIGTTLAKIDRQLGVDWTVFHPDLHDWRDWLDTISFELCGDGTCVSAQAGRILEKIDTLVSLMSEAA